MARVDGRRQVNGTWGKVFLEGEEVFEVTSFSAKVEHNKEEVQIAGQMMTDSKILSMKGTGSLTIKKMTSRMLRLIGKKIETGQEPRFTFISEIDDPDAIGAERVIITGVSFDDMTLAEWTVREVGSNEYPFTFTGFELEDLM